MATYVVSLWDFTGDGSLEQIAFVENSLIKITDRAAMAPAGWSYGVCEVGGAKGFFPLNYTEPYEPEKHTNIPPPVVEEIQPAEFPLIEQQPGEQPVPEVSDFQQYSEPIENSYQDNTGGYVDNSFEQQQQPPEEQTSELPPLTNVPMVLPPPGGGTPPPTGISSRPFVRQPIPPSAKGGPTPGPSTPVPSPVKPSPTTTFNHSSPKPSPTTSFNNFNSPKPSPTSTPHVKPTPTSFSPTPKPNPNPGMGVGMGVGSPKPSPTSNPISARAAAPIQRSGSTPRPRPVSTFIQNTPPPSQPMIRGKPVGGFQPSAELPNNGGGGGSPFGVSNGGGGGSPFTPFNGGGGGTSFSPSNGGGGPTGGGEPIPYCEALFDYTGDPSKNIFSFPKGARIELKVKYESGWWSGVLDGVEGYFPSNFVKELPVTPRGRGGPATTDSVTSPRRQQDENRRKSLGAPMSRSVMGPKGGMGGAHSSLSMSQQDMPSARMTFSSPGGGNGGGRGMPVMMGMGGGPVGNGSAEDDKKKKGGIFSALKKKKNKDKAQTHI